MNNEQALNEMSDKILELQADARELFKLASDLQFENLKLLLSMVAGKLLVDPKEQEIKSKEQAVQFKRLGQKYGEKANGN